MLIAPNHATARITNPLCSAGTGLSCKGRTSRLAVYSCPTSHLSFSALFYLWLKSNNPHAIWSNNLYSGLLTLLQDSKHNIQQAAASQLLVYKPAAWDHWCTDRSEQRTGVTIRYSQGDLKQTSSSPRSHLEQEGMPVQPEHCSTQGTPNTPWAAEKGEEPCWGGSRTRCLQPRAEPVLVCCCTVGVLPQMQSPGKSIEISLHTAWQVSAKNDPYRFPTLCKATTP